MRWDLVDEFEFLKRHQSARAHKVFKGTEDFFTDHYPGKSAVPDVLLIEMIAQTGGVLFGYDLDFQKEVILAKISRAQFYAQAAPPCRLTIEASLADEREEGAVVQGEVFWNDRKIAEAEMMLVTMSSESLGLKKKIVFNDTFLKHYNIYEVAKRSELTV